VKTMHLVRDMDGLKTVLGAGMPWYHTLCGRTRPRAELTVSVEQCTCGACLAVVRAGGSLPEAQGQEPQGQDPQATAPETNPATGPDIGGYLSVILPSDFKVHPKGVALTGTDPVRLDDDVDVLGDVRDLLDPMDRMVLDQLSSLLPMFAGEGGKAFVDALGSMFYRTIDRTARACLSPDGTEESVEDGIEGGGEAAAAEVADEVVEVPLAGVLDRATTPGTDGVDGPEMESMDSHADLEAEAAAIAMGTSDNEPGPAV
jgi:hypothetical protein